ncbi:MAG: S8 family serine peptidase [Chitinophagales bacterium]
MKLLLIRSLFVILIALSVCFQSIYAQPKEDKPDFEIEKIPFSESSSEVKLIPGSYIFIFNSTVVPSFLDKYGEEMAKTDDRDQKARLFEAYDQETKAAILKIAESKLSLSPKQIADIYTGSITGFSVKGMDADRAKELQAQVAKMDEFLGMGEDFEMSLNVSAVHEASEEEANELVLAQSSSWGTNYTGWADKTGSAYWAWILDSGIDLDHPDLNVRTSHAKSFVGYTNSANDDHGHGSHVAGIVAAKNNSIGTKGVAAGAWVVPVKVCSSKAKCDCSAILGGLQHVAKYFLAGDVVNMSFGGVPPSWWDNLWNTSAAQTEPQIRNLAKAGVHMVSSAGNDKQKASNVTPARLNGSRLYTISAMDWNYDIANFSNYGNPPMDYAAPGVSILSCYKNGGYAYMDGTSMAAPHVAGILLSNGGTINSSRVLNTDKDSTKDKVAKR